MSTYVRFAVGLLVAGAVSCQTYDFEPVKPLALAQTTQSKTVTAHPLKPDVMILLDKSGSMNGPIVQMNGCNSCASCGQPANCATRISTVRDTMNSYFMVPANGALARFGLTIFPTAGGDQCGGSQPNDVLVDINPASDSDADLQAWSTKVNGQIQGVSAGGGTPTNASLEFVGGLPSLNDSTRDNYVLLLTDGLPNCNAANPNSCQNPTACECTETGNSCNATGVVCTEVCLDQDGTVQAIKDLRMRSIRTIVIGFGSDFASAVALSTLDAMALAGGFQRTCPNGTDAECGSTTMNPNPCNTTSGVCKNGFYAASDGNDLATALNQIAAAIGGDSICTYTLESQPSAQDLVSVLIDGMATTTGPDTWALMDGKIIFQGALCTELQNSTTADPVKVEVRIVQSL